MEVHRTLGAEFLEPAYQAALEIELKWRAIPHEREVDIPIYYKGLPLGVRYRVDFVCFGSTLIELKSLDRLTSRESAQIVHYLAASRIRKGLLVNFGSARLQFKRFVEPSYQGTIGSSSVTSVGPLS